MFQDLKRERKRNSHSAKYAQIFESETNCLKISKFGARKWLYLVSFWDELNYILNLFKAGLFKQL